MSAAGAAESATVTVTADETERFWRAKSNNAQLGITSHEKLVDFLDGGCRRIAEWEPTLDALYFRGQSSIRYGFTTSLFRDVNEAKNEGAADQEASTGSYERVSEKDLADAEARAIAALRAEGLGRGLTDGELLMLMQHHLGPTRLLDVSRTPFESLFFAVENNEDQDGVLFVVQPHDENNIQHVDLGRPPTDTSIDDVQPLPWRENARGTKYAKGDWTNQVSIVDHVGLHPRMRAQNGVFLVGGLIRQSAGIFYRRGGEDGSTVAGPAVDKDQISLLSNFAINWSTRRQAAPTTASWGATGWVLVIPAEWKRPLREALRAKGISTDTIYPPVVEVVKLMKHVVKNGVTRDARTKAGA